MRVKNGVGVAIIKPCGKVLIGKRKGSHGPATWAFPGGHLETGESIFECAAREALEETGLVLGDMVEGPVTEDYFAENDTRYITHFVVAKHTGGEPELREPEKCEEWNWVDWADIPMPRFKPLDTIICKGETSRSLLEKFGVRPS